MTEPVRWHCFIVFLIAFTEDLIEDEQMFPDDALSNHIDMVDSEPVINEAKRNFIRYWKYLNTVTVYSLTTL